MRKFEKKKKKNHVQYMESHLFIFVVKLPCCRASIGMPGEFRAISAPEVRFQWNGFLRTEPALRGRSAH